MICPVETHGVRGETTRYRPKMARDDENDRRREML